jgi:cell shape-determining protein MreC
VVIGKAQGIVLPQAGGLIIDQVVGEVEVGDNAVSSGVDGIYPPGLLVGSVGDELQRDIFGRYVLNTPLDIQRLDFVSVVVGL